MLTEIKRETNIERVLTAKKTKPEIYPVVTGGISPHTQSCRQGHQPRKAIIPKPLLIKVKTTFYESPF
jgi:hypothetical protein